MSHNDRTLNSGSAAAALGFAVAVDDIENVGNDTNSHNSSSADTTNTTDNDTTDSYNQDNDSLDVSLSDDDVVASNNQDNDTITKTINDNDTYTKTVNLSDNDTYTKTITDIDDSYNQDNDTLNVQLNHSDNDVTDSYNQDNDQDNDVTDSYNTTTTTTDIDTTIDVAISDSFKEITDSYNQDNDWLQLDNLNFDVMNVVGADALAGAGNDAMFNLSQVSELTDNDTLCSPTVSNDAGFDVVQDAAGGYGTGGGDFGDRGTATASADGVSQLEAFTQNIVMGSNIQYNNVEMSVVGGDSTVNDSGDIS